MKALETRALAIGYRRRRRSIVLARGLDLQLRRGSLVGILGANGVGKSTLLRTLARMQAPLAGQVLLDGEDTAHMLPLDVARRLCIVLTAAPQDSLLTGYALVALGRYPHSDWLGRLSKSDHAQVVWALQAVGAADLAERRVSELSDGQRQKLMIARALTQDCPLILLDEPTAFLDYPRRLETLRLLRRLTRAADRAILVCTHELDLALRYCDELWLMSESGMKIGAPAAILRDGSLNEAFGIDGFGFAGDGGSLVPGGAELSQSLESQEGGSL
ncbi:MAG: ABC transporter ATP-binding protein [Chloroflexi bacterium]|nr:ABC transporter ATP-binding protein [Chloroflexota bacterium]MCY4247672.1 ABC transporter ATP-binding protein [Chloroflexota bacterium]